ncbi:MAG: hypothetical protein ACI9JM_002189 [Halioglobus sp.]|jgi:hypothetical protein
MGLKNSALEYRKNEDIGSINEQVIEKLIESPVSIAKFLYKPVGGSPFRRGDSQPEGL